MMQEYCEMGGNELTALVAMLPGPYTFLLKAKRRLPVSNESKLGVRVPEHVFMRTVSKQLGIPIVTTSANVSGGKPPVSLKDVPLQVRGAAGAVIDGGRCKYAQGSTVIDLVERKVLRRGAIADNSRAIVSGIGA
jgi:L-threonylcarbamoyladenylate synthase